MLTVVLTREVTRMSTKDYNAYSETSKLGICNAVRHFDQHIAQVIN